MLSGQIENCSVSYPEICFPSVNSQPPSTAYLQNSGCHMRSLLPQLSSRRYHKFLQHRNLPAQSKQWRAFRWSPHQEMSCAFQQFCQIFQKSMGWACSPYSGRLSHLCCQRKSLVSLQQSQQWTWQYLNQKTEQKNIFYQFFTQRFSVREQDGFWWISSVMALETLSANGQILYSIGASSQDHFWGRNMIEFPHCGKLLPLFYWLGSWQLGKWVERCFSCWAHLFLSSFLPQLLGTIPPGVPPTHSQISRPLKFRAELPDCPLWVQCPRFPPSDFPGKVSPLGEDSPHLTSDRPQQSPLPEEVIVTGQTHQPSPP